MKKEMQTLRHILADPTQCKWEVPIRHLIPSNYDCTALGDTCLEGGGAFCDEFRFWYYLEWRDEIKQLTLKHNKNKKTLVSINCLEFAIIIISYNAILDAIELLALAKDVPHPKSLILSDNRAADAWARKIASSSLIGKLLCQILCRLLMNQVLGLDSGHIAGEENDCADGISRLTKDSLTSIHTLMQKFPKLASYQRYYPNPELISLICKALMNKLGEVPMPLRLKGHFTSDRNIM